MADPISIDIPHRIGRVAAHDRLEKGLDTIAAIVPGGSITAHRWTGDTLDFTLEAMGQRIVTRIDVFEDKVHADVDLPPMLRLFGDKIRAQLADSGTKLLR